MEGPGKMPEVWTEAGESPEMEGVLVTLALDGRCLRKGFLGGSPGRLGSLGEVLASAASDGLALDPKRAACALSGVL